ncbi:MAG: uracil-DNA glycosylase [Marinifilaceae bacterium]|jgi:uracil-DNA glycosylase|nr:uracil-DNA glycosylase [Marinifilaceae bacterium]
MNINIEQSWKEILSDEFDKEYFHKLVNFVKNEYASETIYPEGKNIFRAFDNCPFSNLKLVIIGQDPYHGPGQANGLCFSVNNGIAFPPSLRNIYKELNQDLGITIPESGDLEQWSKQGVLLLNATLTVRAGAAGSHQNKGWEEFTDAVIKQISLKKENIVFLLWGAYAQKKGREIDLNKHYILKSVHPSPLSAHRGFFGNSHFSKANDYLHSKMIEPINWEIK